MDFRCVFSFSSFPCSFLASTEEWLIGVFCVGTWLCTVQIFCVDDLDDFCGCCGRIGMQLAWRENQPKPVFAEVEEEEEKEEK